MSDAAVDVFADAFEADPISEAVRAVLARLATDVENLRGIVGHATCVDQAVVLALIEKATP